MRWPSLRDDDERLSVICIELRKFERMKLQKAFLIINVRTEMLITFRRNNGYSRQPSNLQ